MYAVIVILKGLNPATDMLIGYRTFDLRVEEIAKLMNYSNCAVVSSKLTNHYALPVAQFDYMKVQG